MKILYIDQGDFLGGAELFSRDVLERIKQDPKSPEIVILTARADSKYARLIRELGIKVRETPLPSLPSHFWELPRALFSLKKIIHEEQPDLVHTNTNRAHLIASLALYFHKKPKLTWMLHDFGFRERMLRRCARVPVQVGALPAVAIWVEKVAPKIKKKGKLRRIVNGLDFVKLEALEPAGLTWEKSGLRVGFVGAITPWKGVEVFVRAAVEMQFKDAEMQFVAIGEAQEKDQKFAERMQELGGDQVRWLGWRDDALNVMKDLDVLVHASVQSEPFGRTVIEGMSLGLCVIASQLGGPREIITHGKDGILIPPASAAYLVAALEKVSEDPQKRAELGQAARATAHQHYSLARVAQDLCEMWREAVEESLTSETSD